MWCSKSGTSWQSFNLDAFQIRTWKCFRSKSLSCSEILRSWQLGRIAMNKMPRCHSMKLMIVDGCSILDLKHQLNNCFGKSILLNFNDSMGEGLLCCLVLNYQHFCLESFELQFRNTNGAMFSFRAWHFLWGDIPCSARMVQVRHWTEWADCGRLGSVRGNAWTQGSSAVFGNHSSLLGILQIPNCWKPPRWPRCTCPTWSR